MGTAGEEGGWGVAAAGKGCPSNRSGSIQEVNGTPRCKMIPFTQLLPSTKEPKEPRDGQEVKPKARWGPGLSVGYNLPPSIRERITLNLLV